MSKTPALQPLEKTDYPGLGRLFTKIFGTERSMDAWIWKYDKNPHGSPVATIAAVGEDIVGFYGLLPRRVNFRGEMLTAFQEVDLMVDPDHAAGGLFKHLGRYSYDRLVESGHAFTFGFPNQTSLPLGRRILGWRAIEKIPLWTLILKPASVLDGRLPSIPGLRYVADRVIRFRNRHKLGARYDGLIREVDRFSGSAIDLLTGPVSSGEGIGFIRDPDYLAWRYHECPDHNYVLFEAGHAGHCGAAAVVGLPAGDRAALVEFRYAAGADDAAVALIRIISEVCERKSYATLRAWALDGSPDARFFESIGFFNRDALNFHVIRSFRPPEFNRYLWDGGRWYLSSGDSDCV
ncbi:GNAT family N-acetyltransferase [bacterium]|nr:GNAT family N-acetyltransferase [candidate division CSSED10-310 bacterium]